MNERDLLKQFRNNVSEPSSDAWRQARAAIAAARAEAADAALPRRGLRLPVARLRGRALAALLGATGAFAAAAMAAALVFTAGSAPSVAFAGWRADPTTPASGQVQAAESECQRNSALASLKPALADTRGPYTLLVYADNSRSLCVAGPSIQAPTGRPQVFSLGSFTAASSEAERNAAAERGAPPSSEAETPTSVAPDAIRATVKGGMTSASGAEYSLDVGRVGQDVTAVTLVLEDGSRIKATTVNGWFAAWWPGGKEAQTAEITTANGTVTQQLTPAATP